MPDRAEPPDTGLARRLPCSRAHCAGGWQVRTEGVRSGMDGNKQGTRSVAH
jgi:hypothetical protein